MKLDVVAQNPVEWIAQRFNLIPRPLLDTQVAFLQARVVMAATRLGVFDALSDGPRTPNDLARQCHTSVIGVEKLLFALAGIGYLRCVADAYALTAMSRKWLTAAAPRSMTDMMTLQFLAWEWVERVEEFVVTGQPLDMHVAMTEDADWQAYQRGMRAVARSLSREMTMRLPVPEGAKNMLDIGGSHGHYSAALCRKHPGLHSTILELPRAIPHAAPLLAEENMGDRIVHRPGDALSTDFGNNRYDVVLISMLTHHFSDRENTDLTRRAAAALRPRGIVAIQDFLRPATAARAGQIGALAEFYYALTSRSGSWSVADLQRWQRNAGLGLRRPIKYATIPGTGVQVAVRSRG